MKIIVCVKQVPDTTDVKIDPKTGTMVREGVKSIFNPDDLNALEEALKMKDEAAEASEVICLTMGPPQAEAILDEALAMGADRAILLSDRAFAGADTWATSNTLAAAIKKIGDFDIIFAGRQAIDGDTAQVGPQLAERLNIPQITYVQSFKLEKDAIIAERMLEDGYEIVKTRMPALITAIKELNAPRYMDIRRIYSMFNKGLIEVWTLKDLGIPDTEVGLNASPTKVQRSFSPDAKAPGRMIGGSAKDAVSELVTELRQKHVI
ncbi:MAG: electron transfer flavoprotein subunit beta/FixA family protein [Clostridia bacterium]